MLSLRCDFIDRQLVVSVRMHARVVLHLIHVLFRHHFYIFLLQLESPRQAAITNIGTVLGFSGTYGTHTEGVFHTSLVRYGDQANGRHAY